MATQAVADDELLWAWKPKLHYFEHLLDIVLAEKLNLCYLWNFGEEDLIGTAIDIASMTHRLRTSDRTLDRYYVRLGLALTGRDRVPIGPPSWLLT